ncbi:MAG: tRNA pseudouridine(38-40) synthase TruA [Candidatus Heteroscillospira sp.]|jgi:tRNA pseudouridine38-40 synthase
MRRNIVLTIQYDGSRFNGWQKQGNTQNTIQGRFEALLSRMTGEEVELHGSGRTDAGVHALTQAANFHTDCPLSCREMMDYINEYLPRDAAVTAVREAAPRFHARLNAVKKRYRYRVRESAVPDVFSRSWVWELGHELDVPAMELAASLLCGRHDFTSFCDNRRMKKSAVRTLYSVSFSRSGGELIMDFTGDGFLYHMVRLLTGTLVEVGLGERDAAELVAVLEARDRSLAGALAPAQGLCLMEVYYD